MDSFLKKIVAGDVDEESRRFFFRYGKGDYNRRFLISFNKRVRIKIKGSFEWANDFVNFVRECGDFKFSGKILSKEKIPGRESKKKGGSFVYEIEESSLEEFENAYSYLLSCDSEDIVLKIKKKLPKPGKNEEKIDDKFCYLELDPKYWDAVREAFFWDLGECGGAKKASIEHELKITEIEIPSGVSADEVREKAIRKGKIIRKIDCDGKVEERVYDLEV